MPLVCSPPSLTAQAVAWSRYSSWPATAVPVHPSAQAHTNLCSFLQVSPRLAHAVATAPAPAQLASGLPTVHTRFGYNSGLQWGLPLGLSIPTACPTKASSGLPTQPLSGLPSELPMVCTQYNYSQPTKESTLPPRYPTVSTHFSYSYRLLWACSLLSGWICFTHRTGPQCGLPLGLPEAWASSNYKANWPAKAAQAQHAPGTPCSPCPLQHQLAYQRHPAHAVYKGEAPTPGYFFKTRRGCYFIYFTETNKKKRQPKWGDRGIRSWKE